MADLTLDEALDIIEMLVKQYMPEVSDNYYGHYYMMAGERATDVLCETRPEHWQDCGDGVRWMP